LLQGHDNSADGQSSTARCSVTKQYLSRPRNCATLDAIGISSCLFVRYCTPVNFSLACATVSNATSQQAEINVQFLSVGDADWIRNVMIPLADELQQAIPRHIGEIPPALRQRMTRSGACNSALVYAVAAVTVYFLKKVADDFYDVVIKPRSRKIFEHLDEKLTGANRKAKKVFIVNAWHQEHGVVVTVSVVGADFDEITSQMDLIGTVHRQALTWITQNGVSAPVHHYRIENGQVNEKPMLLDRAEDAAR
jgi:hypothetical protein